MQIFDRPGPVLPGALEDTGREPVVAGSGKTVFSNRDGWMAPFYVKTGEKGNWPGTHPSRFP
jgi:hypothetical protein